MYRPMRLLTLSLTAAILVGIARIAPAGAADAMAAPPIDCSKAETMMMAPMKSGDAMHDMKMTGNVDADFAQMMMMHNQGMMTIAKIEVACGKDAKTKALAQKHLDQASSDNAVLQGVITNSSKI